MAYDSILPAAVMIGIFNFCHSDVPVAKYFFLVLNFRFDKHLQNTVHPHKSSDSIICDLFFKHVSRDTECSVRLFYLHVFSRLLKVHNRLFCELCYIQVAERETLILSNRYVLDKLSKTLNICLQERR